METTTKTVAEQRREQRETELKPEYERVLATHGKAAADVWQNNTLAEQPQYDQKSTSLEAMERTELTKHYEAQAEVLKDQQNKLATQGEEIETLKKQVFTLTELFKNLSEAAAAPAAAAAAETEKPTE